MKNFKVVKCLKNGEIVKYAVFEDGSRKKRIQTDSQNREYFYVDNELNTKVSTSMKYSFSGRIKDAVEMIKLGNGDCIKNTDMFESSDSVLYFLDRKIGEEYRKKFINGWKDTKFGWTIEVENKNSFYPYSFYPYFQLNENLESISYWNADTTPLTFDSEESALEKIHEIIQLAHNYAIEILEKMNEETDEKKKEEAFNKAFDKIQEKIGERSVLINLIYDFFDDDLTEVHDELNHYGYKIVQCII